jgi:GT2 family glycosyltransferase
LDDFRAAGGLDAAFFAHQEEIDLCWRLHARGRRLVCLPQSVVYHLGAATLQQSNPQKTYLNFRNNLLMLYKNLPNPAYRRAMRARFFLDYLSAVHCLVQGRWADAGAIYRARRDFKRMRAAYRAVREENLRLSKGELPATLWRKRLLCRYYLLRETKFATYEQGWLDGLH